MNTILKSFLSVILFTIITAGIYQCTRKQVSLNTTNKKPNIIYILADDLGYGELGCYGQQKIETPNIDALAANGIRFTNHYSGSPVCAPSRCVLLTGKHTGHAHIRGNDEWAERGDTIDYAMVVNNPNLEGQQPLLPLSEEPTIGSLLQSAGYKTGIVGKWGLGAPLSDGIPNNRGFDFFYGYNCQRQAHTYYPKYLWRNKGKVWLDNELVVPHTKLDEDADPYNEASYAKYRLKEYAPVLMYQEALHFIRENKGQPFFLYYASPIPHVPLQAPKQWVDYYVKKYGDEEPYQGEMKYFPCRYPRATYAAMISYLDEQVGGLVAELKKLGIYENTLIIFSSDNGPTCVGGVQPQWFNSGGLFKSEWGWGKATVHEGGIRVPMIAQWPGKIEAGSETSLISAFYDVLPTICELTGIKVPAGVDGISFLPVLFGKEQQKHNFLYWEFPGRSGQQAVRMGKWKAIRMNILQGNLDIKLFDLENDIQEQHNVAGQNPEIVEQIKTIMEKQHIPSTIERFKMKYLGD